MRLAVLVFAFSIGAFALNLAVAERGKEVVSLSGRQFRAIEVAAREMEQRGIKVEPYEIQVGVSADPAFSPDSTFVLFIDPHHQPGQGYGGGPNMLTIQVELKTDTFSVVRFTVLK